MDSEPINVVAHTRALSRASGTLSRSESRPIARCCEVGKEVQIIGARNLIPIANGGPLLRSATADGTPCRVTRRERIKLADGSTFVSSGQEALHIIKWRGGNQGTEP